MRICIVNEFFYPDDAGGTGTVLSSLARSLRAQYDDIEIDVITSRSLYRGEAATLPACEDWGGIRIFRLSTPRPNGLSPLPRLGANSVFGGAALLHLRRRPRYDLLLVGTAPPTLALAAQVYQRMTRTPYLYVVYDLEPDRAIALGMLPAGSPVARMLRACQKTWLHSAARTVVLGRCMRDHLGQAYQLHPRQVKVIPIGADPEEIVPLSRQTRFRARHGLDGFVVCYSGNFGRYHNFDTILDAAKRLRDRAGKITLVLVGDGAQKAHIAGRIAREGLCNVRLFPFVPREDYPDLLASADASLVTLEPGMEGLCVPSKFYSILASGRPTLALVSPQSEVALVLAEAQCGVQIDQADTEALVNTLSHLAGHPAEAERLGRNARQTLVDHYSLGHIARRYRAAMLAAIEDGSRKSDMRLSGAEIQADA